MYHCTCTCACVHWNIEKETVETFRQYSVIIIYTNKLLGLLLLLSTIMKQLTFIYNFYYCKIMFFMQQKGFHFPSKLRMFNFR